jgi:hypothetical protein
LVPYWRWPGHGRGHRKGRPGGGQCRRGRRRFIAGADAIRTAQQKVVDLQADIDLNRERFVSLDLDAG